MENETMNPDFASPCGLYCGVCAIFIAHRDNNRKFKERLAGLYKGGVPGKGTLSNRAKIDWTCTCLLMRKPCTPY